MKSGQNGERAYLMIRQEPENQNYPVAVAQEHSLGCAVACVASRCQISYESALRLFAEPKLAWVRGYYCTEVIEALRRAGIHYSTETFDPSLHQKLLERIGTIVFLEPSELYPVGHYLIRSNKGWMNPWVNFPSMNNVRADFQNTLPNKILFVLHEN